MERYLGDVFCEWADKGLSEQFLCLSIAVEDSGTWTLDGNALTQKWNGAL